MRKELVDAIMALEDDEGRLTPDKLVDVAKDPNSVLHDEFPWDDAIAAHKHRLDVARALIRKVEVHIVVNRVKTSVVAYVRDPESPGGVQGYRSVRKLRTEEEVARSALEAEFDAAASRLRRARDLAIALGLEGEIDRYIDELTMLKDRVVGNPSEGDEIRPN